MQGRRIIASLVISAALVLGTGSASLAAPATATTPAPAGGIVQQIATIEGVTPQMLRQDLRQGQTLLQIAAGKYTSADALATALLAPVKVKLDAAVSSGKLSAARENLTYTTALSKVTVLVVTPHPLQALRRAMGSRLQSGWRQVVREVASACTTTPAALTKLLRAGGTSVLAACQTTNASATETQLIGMIYAPFEARLNRAVAKGTITQAREQELGATIQSAIGTVITAPLPAKS